MSIPQRAQRDTNRVVTLIGVSSDGSGATTRLEVDPITGRLLTTSIITSGLAPAVYDAIQLSNYSGTNPQTIQYFTGGTSGTLVGTISLTYDGSGNILTVVRT